MYDILKEEYISLLAKGDMSAQKYSEYVSKGAQGNSPVELYAQRLENILSVMSVLEYYMRIVDSLTADLVLGKINGPDEDILLYTIMKDCFFSGISFFDERHKLGFGYRKMNKYVKRLLSLVKDYENAEE